MSQESMKKSATQNPSEIEQKIRARLPMIRLMQVYMPLPITQWLVKKGVERVQMPTGITRS